MEQFDGMGWTKVAVTQEEKDLCAKYGKARTDFQKDTPSILGYEGKNFRVTGWRSDALGVLAEMAVVKLLGLPTFDSSVWTFYSENKEDFKKPEICGVVEVRRVTVPGNPLRIYKKDVEDKAINVLTYAPLNAENKLAELAVWVCGWDYAEEAWKHGQPSGVNPDLRKRSENRLRPPETLPAAFAERVTL